MQSLPPTVWDDHQSGVFVSGSAFGPLPDAEVARIINQVEEGGDTPRSLIAFEVGEKVNVTDGPFEGFSGTVEEVDDINSRLKLTVSIFGRATPVELEFTQVQKQN